jgi:hypothetical protein
MPINFWLFINNIGAPDDPGFVQHLWCISDSSNSGDCPYDTTTSLSSG